jgi:NAD(P)-dependent dehydrogenase (short-subunit alcohol dehydrogenase family)
LASASPEPKLTGALRGASSLRQLIAQRSDIQEIPMPALDQTVPTKTFGATSTTDDVLEGVSLKGKRVLVTGVSAGLGVETARALVAHGAEVVGAARDLAKAKGATAGVRAANGGGLELIELDLASLDSVRVCANALVDAGKPFDLVVCNAGIMGPPFGKTVDGFEMQFGTNHLGHFVLVNRIASLMRPGSRLVNLSSAGHRRANVDVDDPNFERTPYEPFTGYGRSKTANILFAVEFDRRHKENGTRATAVHPGVIQTELGRDLAPDMIDRIVEQANAANLAAGRPPFQWKSISQGAATSVWAGAVANADEVGARYCEDCHVAEVVADDATIPWGVRGYALNPETARALWAKSEQMVGERF